MSVRTALPLLTGLARYLLILAATAEILAAQSPASPGPQLPLKAVLVLSQEFCATKMPKGGRVEVGKLACADFEPALRDVFPRLTVTAEVPKTVDAQIVLIPAFVDLAATTGMTAFSDRKLDVFLQWTAKDASGKTVWIETVRGSATHRAGTLFTYSKNFKLMVSDAVRDMASQSATKMSASPELRKLSD
jgi:hypothetical protein